MRIRLLVGWWGGGREREGGGAKRKGPEGRSRKAKDLFFRFCWAFKEKTVHRTERSMHGSMRRASEQGGALAARRNDPRREKLASRVLSSAVGDGGRTNRLV